MHMINAAQRVSGASGNQVIHTIASVIFGVRQVCAVWFTLYALSLRSAILIGSLNVDCLAGR